MPYVSMHSRNTASRSGSGLQSVTRGINGLLKNEWIAAYGSRLSRRGCYPRTGTAARAGESEVVAMKSELVSASGKNGMREQGDMFQIDVQAAAVMAPIPAAGAALIETYPLCLLQ